MQQPIIIFDHVSLLLSGKKILDDISFSIDAGEFITILGPNGAGKSTLLKLLLGLYKPTNGVIRILGKQARKGNNQIGYAPQHRTLDADLALRARDIVGFGYDGNKWGFGLPNKQREVLINNVLNEVDMIHLAEMPVGKLSGGEQQRLLIAQALLTNPDILLLDEPLSNLDITHGRAIVHLIKAISQQRKITILLVTHDINPLLNVSDQVMYMANTKSALGKPDDIITTHELTKLYGSPIEVIHTNGRVFVIGEES